MAKLELREDIAEAWDLVESKLGLKTAVRELAGHLLPDERVERLGSGWYSGATAMVAVTDQRVIFLRSDFKKSKAEAFRYRDITHVSYATGTLTGLAVSTIGGKATLRSMDAKEGQDIAELIQHHIEVTRTPAGADAPTMSDSADPTARLLAMLAELHAADVLTADELKEKSARLLARR